MSLREYTTEYCDGELFVCATVVIRGLKERSQFNGVKGELLEFYPDQKRWAVRVMTSPANVVKIKSQNLDLDEVSCRIAHGSKRNYIEWRRSFLQSLLGRVDTSMPVCVSSTKELENSWYVLLDSDYTRSLFSQVTELWAKVGERYTAWFQDLPESQAFEALCKSKHNYIHGKNFAGQNVSRHIPAPAGVVTDNCCLLPELQTRGPYFDHLPDDALRDENTAARSWLEFLRTRLDPTCFREDIRHCAMLRAAGRMPAPYSWEEDLRSLRFCVAGSAAAALDPRTLPNRIFLVSPCSVPPCRAEGLSAVPAEAPTRVVILPDSAAPLATDTPAEAEKRAAAAEQRGESMELELFVWADAGVYRAALHRLLCLTDMLLMTLSSYRCGAGQIREGEER